MILECHLFFKRYFNNITSIDNFFRLDSNQFQHFENLIINEVKCSRFHSHDFKNCKSNQLSYYQSYERAYIYRKGDETFYSTVCIPVFYCNNCEHYHALLPCFLIIPYIQYSMMFLLEIFYMRFQMKWTVSNVLDVYNISESSYYEWLHRYHKYYRIWLMFHTRKTFEFFLITNVTQFIEELCQFPFHANSTLFQRNRKLWNSS